MRLYESPQYRCEMVSHDGHLSCWSSLTLTDTAVPGCHWSTRGQSDLSRSHSWFNSLLRKFIEARAATNRRHGSCQIWTAHVTWRLQISARLSLITQIPRADRFVNFKTCLTLCKTNVDYLHWFDFCVRFSAIRLKMLRFVQSGLELLSNACIFDLDGLLTSVIRKS